MVSDVEVEKRVNSVRGLAIHLATRIHVVNSTYDLEDMIQAAFLGATEAAHKYEDEHESGASFSTYAIHKMKQEIRLLYYNSSVTKIPRKHYEVMTKPERVAAMFNFSYTSQPISVHQDGAVKCLGDTLSAPVEPGIVSKASEQDLLKRLLMSLSHRQRFIVMCVYGFFGAPMTIAAASDLCHVTRAWGSVNLQRALDKIRRLCRYQGISPQWFEQ